MFLAPIHMAPTSLLPDEKRERIASSTTQWKVEGTCDARDETILTLLRNVFGWHNKTAIHRESQRERERWDFNLMAHPMIGGVHGFSKNRSVKRVHAFFLFFFNPSENLCIVADKKNSARLLPA